MIPRISRSLSKLNPISRSLSLSISFQLPKVISSLLQSPSSSSSSSPSLATAYPSTSSQSYQSISNEAQSESCLDWDGILNAVPKKKVSHSRKSMRSANKGLKNRTDFAHCPGCGSPKLSHHICAICFGEISKRQKSESRLQFPTPIPQQ